MRIRQLHIRPSRRFIAPRSLHGLSPETGGAASLTSLVTLQPTAQAMLTATIEPDPELTPRQNLIFHLQLAAEIEHSLLVQYLYAAYSLRPTAQAGGAPTDTWRNEILKIAREEMGHLLSVQNVLRFVGGPLHLDRQHFPYRSQFYPFPFMLQRLTKKTLAKYVFAEMPADGGVIPAADLADIERLAKSDAGDVTVNHVGTLYATLETDFDSLQGIDFSDTTAWQALAQTTVPPQTVPSPWIRTNDSKDATAPGVHVYEVHDMDSAVAALKAIAAQGEGTVSGGIPAPAVALAHYKRFFDIYKAFPDSSDAITFPVPDNPNTTDPPTLPIPDAEGHLREDQLKGGRITRAETLSWAHLFNVRYRMLLAELSHALLMPVATVNGVPAVASAAGAVPTPRPTLAQWVYEDMKSATASLKNLAAQIVLLDRTDAPMDGKAGPTFELPYTLDLPDRAIDRWQLHNDLAAASVNIVNKLKELDPANQTLTDIASELEDRQTAIAANASSPF